MPVKSVRSAAGLSPGHGSKREKCQQHFSTVRPSLTSSSANLGIHYPRSHAGQGAGEPGISGERRHVRDSSGFPGSVRRPGGLGETRIGCQIWAWSQKIQNSMNPEIVCDRPIDGWAGPETQDGARVNAHCSKSSLALRNSLQGFSVPSCVRRQDPLFSRSPATLDSTEMKACCSCLK